MTERQGVEIDYCPTCRGVWLDRGELDKIIDRSDAQGTPAARPAAQPPPDPRTESAGSPAQAPHQQYPAYPSSPDSPDYRGGYGQGYDPRYGQRRRKQSFLGDLFDF
jgi:uncharacterized protein